MPDAGHCLTRGSGRLQNVAETSVDMGTCRMCSSLAKLSSPLLGLVCTSRVAVVFESRKLTYQRVSSTSARARRVWKFICSNKSQTLETPCETRNVDSTVVKTLLFYTFVARSCSATQVCEPRLLRPVSVLASGKAIRNRDQYLETADSAGQGTLGNGKY